MLSQHIPLCVLGKVHVVDIDGCVSELPPVIVVPGGVGTCARGVGYSSMTFTSNIHKKQVVY